MKKAFLRLRVLSPVHIGTGESLTPLEYVLAGGKIKVVSIDALAEKLNSHQLRHFGQEVLPLDRFLRNVQASHLLNKPEIFTRELFLFGEAARKLPRDLERGTHQAEIMETVKTLGAPFVPGSSVKGAVRTAIAFQRLGSDRQLFNRLIDGLIGEHEEGRKRLGCKDAVETIVFRNGNDGKKKRGESEIDQDALHLLGFSDSRPLSEKALGVFLFQRLGMGGRGVSGYLECLLPGSETELEVRFPSEEDFRKRKNARGLVPESPRELFRALNSFSKAIIDFELKHFNWDEAGVKLRLEEFYQKLKDMMTEDRAVFPLGFGTGWSTKSVGLLFKRWLTPQQWQDLVRKCFRGMRVRSNFPQTKAYLPGISGRFPPVLGWVELSAKEVQ